MKYLYDIYRGFQYAVDGDSHWLVSCYEKLHLHGKPTLSKEGFHKVVDYHIATHGE